MSYQHHPVHTIGGRICLDFLNTANWTVSGDIAVEHLTNLQDLGIWKQAIGLKNHTILDEQELQQSVLQFRSTVRQIFLPVINGDQPHPSDTRDLNNVLALPMPANVIEFPSEHYSFNPDLTLTKVIALSAASILTSPDEIQRVKMCPAENCGWLFVDESRNSRRTWCSMELCGNRAKARRHYNRQIQSSAIS